MFHIKININILILCLNFVQVQLLDWNGFYLWRYLKKKGNGSM